MPEIECTCESTVELEADNEEGFVLLHFEDCDLISKQLVEW